jgi:hypothetical protein
MASAENTRLRQDMMNKLRKARAEKAKTMSTNDDPLFNESTPESNSDSTTLDRLFYSQVFEGGKDYIEKQIRHRYLCSTSTMYGNIRFYIRLLCHSLLD